MQLANQTFYFSSLIILLGLMAGCFSRKDGTSSNKQTLYWPLLWTKLTLEELQKARTLKVMQCHHNPDGEIVKVKSLD